MLLRPVPHRTSSIMRCCTTASAGVLRSEDNACLKSAVEYSGRGESRPGTIQRGVRVPTKRCTMSPLLTNDAVHAKLVWDSPIAILVSTLADGRILEVNDSFVDLFGYARDEMIGQTSVGLGLWVDPEQRAQLTAALMAGQSLRDFEATVRTKSGAELQVLAAVSHVEIDGRTCLLTQLFDVTAYRQGETQFRALVEQLPIITYTHALDDPLTITYISPQVETVLGYAPSEVLAGQPAFLTTRTHADDRTSLREAVERTRATGEPF